MSVPNEAISLPKEARVWSPPNHLSKRLPGAVTNSATAGQALVELANTLPKCGGLAEVFTGSNSLAAFGDDIIQFGEDHHYLP